MGVRIFMIVLVPGYWLFLLSNKNTICCVSLAIQFVLGVKCVCFLMFKGWFALVILLTN